MVKTRESSCVYVNLHIYETIKQMWLWSKIKFDSGFQKMCFVVFFCLDTGYSSTHVTSTSTNISFFALQTSGTFSPDKKGPCVDRRQTSEAFSGGIRETWPIKNLQKRDLSNEQKPSLFRAYSWWDTTRFCGDYQKPISEFLFNNQYLMESKKGFFSWLTWNWDGKKKHLQNQQMS